MKKVISIFLAALMLCSLFVMAAGAEIYDEDFTPGVVVVGVEFDAPSIETLLKDFEIEEATETGTSCVHNTYLVKFKEKTKEIVLRAIEVLEKSSYVLYAAPEYIYQEEGSTEPVTSEPVNEKPSDSAEIYDEDFTPGVVVVGVEFDAPAIETLLKDFEIEEVNETGASCVHNTYLVKFKDKTKEIVLRAIEELEKSSYVLYAAPDYIYQEEGSTEPVSSESVVTAPSETNTEVTQPSTQSSECKYEDKFIEQYNADKEKLIPGEYSYSELYYHLDEKEEVDWVLVDAFVGCQADAETYVIIGDVYGREIYSGCIFSPFETRYGVYDVKEGKFYDIKDYQNVFGRMYELIQVLEELNIGGRVNIEPPEPTATNPEVTEPNTAAPIITEPINTDPIVTEPVTLPISTDSVVTTPDATQPVVTEPVATNPVVTKPSQPASSKPVVSPKKGNPIKVSAKTKSIKAKNLKKKKQTVKPLAIKDAQGAVTVTKVKKGTTSKIFKKITVNRKTGAITFKKGKYAKKTYKIKLKIKAKGSSTYSAKTVTKVVKIKVK